MKNILKNPIFITALVILLGAGGLVYGLTKLVKSDNLPPAAAVERSKGKTDSSVVFTEYADFQCPACKTFHDTVMPQVESKYKDKIKIVFKHYPLSQIHGSALRAAEAAEAAGAQGKFWEYNDKLYERQTLDAEAARGDQWTYDELIGYAKDLGLDTARFEKELRGDMYRDVVKNSQKEAEDKGFTGTPTIVINGEKIDNPTFENIEKKLNELLGEQNVANTTTPTVTPTPGS